MACPPQLTKQLTEFYAKSGQTEWEESMRESEKNINIIRDRKILLQKKEHDKTQSKIIFGSLLLMGITAMIIGLYSRHWTR